MREHTYQLIDHEGQHRADHVRVEYDDGGKSFFYRLAGAPTAGLKGLKKDELPLYGIHDDWLKDKPIIVTEGEKACDALSDRGIPAVGTATGADGTPCDASLLPLTEHPTILLWPDADTVGREHMDRIGQRLLAIGAPDVRVLTWKDAPPKGDAADFIGSNEDLAAMLRTSSVPLRAPAQAVQRRTRFTAAELMLMTFEAPRFLIARLLPAEGVVLLVGAPKLGKSWMALGIAVAVAAAGRALGKLSVERGGDVLYVSLEDTARRLSDRLDVVIADGEEAPPSLEIWTELPRLDDRGLDELRRWLVEHPNARLIVIDVFARVRPGRSRNGSAYDEDYQAVASVQSLAMEFGITILLVHHDRKASADDWLDTVNGTTGITGAADAILLLKRARGEHDAELLVTGRDLDELAHALTFDALAGPWRLTGDAQDLRLSVERRDVLAAVQRASGPVGPKEVATATNRDYAAVRQLMSRMAIDGDLKVVGRGRYVDPHHNDHKVTTEALPLTDCDLVSDVTRGMEDTSHLLDEALALGAERT